MAGGTPEDDATRLALAEFREGNLLAKYLAPLQQARTPVAITLGSPAEARGAKAGAPADSVTASSLPTNEMWPIGKGKSLAPK